MQFSIGVSASVTKEPTYLDVDVLLLVHEGIATLMPITMLHENMFVPPSVSYSDSQMWAAKVLRNIAAKLESNATEGSGLTRAELMLRLSEHK